MGLNKKIILAGLLFVSSGQLIAILVFYLLEKSIFQTLFVASVVGFLISYKKIDSKEK